VLLREALENGPGVLSVLEKEGVIQRFEYAFELAWKTIKDFLEVEGLVVSPVTPRQVIKDAFAAKVFTWRAKGNSTPMSGVDWALLGDIAGLRAEGIAAGLDVLSP
jgi:Nucleotidyltransferase substrate binding protein like